MLSIKNLKVTVEGEEILHGLNLEMKKGELHAIMGPNGSGKSTLSNTLMGHPKYRITGGSVKFMGKDLLAMKPEERAQLGLFLAFQYPKEIPGVNLVSFLRAAYNALRPKEESISLYHFKKKMQEMMELVGLSADFMERSTNEGFSGGEKKKTEMLQWAMLEPQLAILDETDSGLDIDALRTVCETIQKIRKPHQSLLLVTHYQRILDYITPDKVHVMMDGRIVMSDGPELAQRLEKEGYEFIREQVGLRKRSGLKVLNPSK